MPYRKIVDLVSCRDLLETWLEVRNKIISGKATGLMVCLKNVDGTESIGLGGVYQDSPDDALKASMRMSWEATKRSGVLPP